MSNFTERQKWFIGKIGSILFRNDNGCNCDVCKHILDHGLMVNDVTHAKYLCDIEAESNAERTPLKYFDTKEERDEWLKTLPK